MDQKKKRCEKKKILVCKKWGTDGTNDDKSWKQYDKKWD